MNFTDDAIERISAARVDDVLLELSQAPQQAAQAQAQDVAMERATRVFDDFEEGIAYEAATGRAAPVPRLRAERIDDEDPDGWKPGMDVNYGLEKADGVPAIRERGLPGSARKLRDGTVLVFGLDGSVAECYSDGSVPPEVLELIEE